MASDFGDDGSFLPGQPNGRMVDVSLPAVGVVCDRVEWLDLVAELSPDIGPTLGHEKRNFVHGGGHRCQAGVDRLGADDARPLAL